MPSPGASRRSGVRGGGATRSPTTRATAATSPTHCASGYTFFRRDTQVRSTADQLDAAHEWVYIVYDASKPGTEVADRHDLRLDRAGRRQPVGDLLPALRRRDRRAHRADPDRRPGERATSSSRTSRPTAACSTRSGGTAGTTRATARRGRSATAPTGTTVPSLDVYGATLDRPRARPGRPRSDHRRDDEPELRAVRRPRPCRSPATTSGSRRSAASLRRRGPTGATPCRAPTRASDRRTRTTERRRPAVPHVRPPDEGAAAWSGDHLPARRRPRPEHLRRPRAVDGSVSGWAASCRPSALPPGISGDGTPEMVNRAV